MNEPQTSAPSAAWRVARIAALGLGTVFLVGAVAGFLMAHFEEEEGSLTLSGLAILAAFILGAGVCGWLLRRELRAAPAGEPLTDKERLNRNILLACGALGGVIGAALALVEGPAILESRGLFSDAPLPTWFAALLVLTIGVLLPAIALYWHRHAIDEQEADAYKSGALAALYLYMIGAPAWWFAWRGGLAPEPNGVIIYMATLTVVGVVWLWKKYR